MKTELHLTAEEMQLVIDALYVLCLDLRFSPETRARARKLKEELEHP